MEYLVDGYNLLHAWDRALPEKDDLESARRRLLDALADFGARTGSRVVTVFDGTDLPYSDRASHREVKVRFSRSPKDADRLIADLLAKTDHARETAVVSSDNAVRAAARAAGAKSVSSAEFSALLRRKEASPVARPSGATALSDSEVQNWARTFGVRPEDGMGHSGVKPLKKKGGRK